MIAFIDNFLNTITMYRLVLYELCVLLAAALLFSLFGLLPFHFLDLLFSTFFLLAVCWLANTACAKFFKAPTNVESVYISALILVLIITPAKTFNGYAFLAWAGVAAMASKYLLAIGKKHLFNPAAAAVAFTAIALNQSASWWIGTRAMLPFVMIGGFLIIRKIRRFDLVFWFLLASFSATFLAGVFQKADVLVIAKQAVLDSSIWFFAFVMLTEPLTTPPTKRLQIIYGALTGILFAPQTHLGGFYFTPELALLAGNVFSYLASPKEKLRLRLKERIELSPGLYDFVFEADKKMKFHPGQYLEWTLGHAKPDSRGNRRYFTVASSPTEKDFRIGVKIQDPASSFKRSLLAMKKGDEIMASQLAGDFTLPRDPNQPCVFIAGGIGITPFRSMVKYLLDTRQKRPIVLLYAARHAHDVVYTDVFEAAREVGVKSVYLQTDGGDPPAGWPGRMGQLDARLIQHEVPDYQSRMFYLSGPHAMVTAFERTLADMGVSASRIITDYFPGFV